MYIPSPCTPINLVWRPETCDLQGPVTKVSCCSQETVSSISGALSHPLYCRLLGAVSSIIYLQVMHFMYLSHYSFHLFHVCHLLQVIFQTKVLPYRFVNLSEMKTLMFYIAYTCCVHNSIELECNLSLSKKYLPTEIAMTKQLCM